MENVRVLQAGRRNLLKRGAIAAGAAVAFLAGKGEARAAVATPGSTLRLFGRSWYTHSAHLGPGERPSGGDRLSVYGELTATPGGAAVGEFYAAAFCLESPYRSSSLASGALEVHTLVLGDGTIVGVGAGSGAERAYAIVGGTGRYAGARGSYLARQDGSGSGDGSVELLITLL